MAILLKISAIARSTYYYTVYYEESLSGTNYGYTNAVFPSTSIEEHQFYYYDNYDLNNDGTADYTYTAQSLEGETTPVNQVRGLMTAVKKRIVGTANWLTSVTFYDKWGRTIQVLSNNQLNLAMGDSKTMVPDFTGRVLRAKTVKAVPSGSTTVLSIFVYDHMSRIKSIDDSYNGANAIRIASYSYNEIGQLVRKNLHGMNSSSTSYLQSVDYRYNIRGQMTSINNSTLTADDKNEDGNDLFGMEMLYNVSNTAIGNTGHFDGQLSAVTWQSKNPQNGVLKQRSYRFDYDKVGRLRNALYLDRAGMGSWANAGAFDEKNISYDENGNILSLERNAAVGGSITVMDNLQYSYVGNRLLNVVDEGSASLGFKNLTGSTAVYAHDLAGNLSVDPKKGISIVYNVLNKTERIIINSAVGRFINYTYDGSGVLLRKQQYDNNVLQKTTDYIEGFVYENSTLAYFGMAEGRVRNTGSSLKPEYVITDFQGNARVSFEEQNGQAVLRQENSYYPFGLVMPGGLLPTEPNKQLYNGGSEWQNDFADLPDYFSTFYRNYEAALGRFIAVDPLAQENESISPYNYALNNPIRFNDPMGDISRDVTPNELFGGGGGYGGTWTRGGGITWFTSDTDAFGAGVEYLDATNGWGYTLTGNFDTAWTRLHENRTGKQKEDGGTTLRVVHINETKTNKNWLIERLDEANQGGGYLDKAWDWAKEHFEVSGGYELSYGFQIGGGFKKGVAAFVNAKSIVHSDLSFSNKAQISANKYRPGEKATHGIGGAYYLGVDYKRETINGQSLNTVSVGIVGFGGNVTWGQNGITNWFVGFDPSFKVAFGVGLEGNFRVGFSK